MPNRTSREAVSWSRARRSGPAFVAFAGLVLLSRPALALPSPFIFAFVVDVLVQSLVLAVLLAPLAWDGLRERVYRFVPSVRGRGVLGLLLVTVAAGSASLVVESPRPPPMDPAIVAAPTRCEPLDAALAERLRLPAGAVLVDPRPPTSFHAYHLKGSCQRSPDRLRNDPTALEGLAPGTRVLLIEDNVVTPDAVFGGPPPAHLSHLSFGSVPGGVRKFYSEGSRGAWGQAPDLVVSAEGSPHQQFGPVWMKGRYATVMGLDRGWRHLGESAIPFAKSSGIAVVDVRERRATNDLPGVIPWNATVAEAEKAIGGSADGLLVLCDGSTDCLAGEALAWELRQRGASVYGYVRSESVSGDLLKKPFFAPSTSHWLAPALVLLLLLAAAGLAHVVGMLARRLALPSFAATAPILALGLVVVAGLFARRFTSEPGEVTLATLRLVDLRRFGVEWLFAGLPALYAAFCFLAERRLARGRWLVRLAPVLALAYGSVHRGAEELRDFFAFDLVLLGAALGGQVAYLLAVEWWERRRAALGAGARVVELAAAGAWEGAGGKVIGLAKAARAGHPVPSSVVACLSAGSDAATLERLANECVGRLGRGPLVVRSSAPDEDRSSATPGKYASVVGVEGPEVATALRRVLDSYGVDPAKRVAVLVQRLVAAEWAGVAVREPESRGGGIVVEASKGGNQGVTAGERAERRDRLGAWSRRWGTRALEGVIPASSFLGTFERVERDVAAPLDLEWAWSGGRLVVLQARAAPEEASSTGTEAPVRALKALSPGLRWLRGRPDRLVLEVGDFAEFGDDVSPASEALLVELWSIDGAMGAAVRRVFPAGIAAFSTPSVVGLGGRLYTNRVPPGPRALLASPVLRVHRLALPWRRRSLFRALDAELRRLERALPQPPTAAASLPELAQEVLERRRVLLGEPARLAATVALLQASSRLSAEHDPDPLLALVSAGRTRDATKEGLGWRALPDLSLETPRLGESDGAVPSGPVSIDAPPLPDDAARAITQLRARARQVLAAHACGLRAAMLKLGSGAFDLTPDGLARVANGESIVPSEAGKKQASGAPARLTLRGLETWAGTGVPGSADDATAGVWATGVHEVEGEVGPAECGGVVVVGLPTVTLVASLPAGTVVLAAGGTALCHAALVARQRGLHALFAAGDGVLALAPGDRVRLRKNARWERIAS